MLDAPHLARAAEPGLHLVDDEHDAVVVADPPYSLEELRRRDDEPALPLYRLDHDCRNAFRRDLGDERALQCAERLRGSRAAVLLREGKPVHLGRERAEPYLVRMSLGGQRQRQQRSSVKAALEADHGRALGVGPRELDGVLDRLGARVEECGLRLPRDRRCRNETLGERDVDLVRHDREVGMEELRRLLGDRFDHTWMRVADVEAADAAGEVEEGVAVDVRERGTLAVLDHDRQEDGKRIGDNPVLALEDLLRAGPRNPGLELDRLRGGH